MIRFKIKYLIADKEVKEKRKITQQEVADATGIARTSLSKMGNPSVEFVSTTANIDALCKYFDCRVEDVIEYVEDDS